MFLPVAYQTNKAIKLGPNYQVPFAQAIYNETQLPVITVGLITEPEQAEAILLTEQADFIALAENTLYPVILACG